MRTRMHQKRMESVRLAIYRSPRHIYAQIISPENGKVLAQASTLDKDVKAKLKQTGNIDAAKHIGQLIAERAVEVGVKAVAFDRAGFKYHGRVKALADAARDGGLEF